MKSLFAIENLGQSQCELRMLPTRPLCIFHDMTDSLVDGIRDVLKQKGEFMIFEDVWKIMGTGQALRKEMPCILHGQLCKVKRAHLHVAGTPCPAWSAQAAGEKKGCSGNKNALTICLLGGAKARGGGGPHLQ